MARTSTFSALLSEVAQATGSKPFLMDDETLGPITYKQLYQFYRGLEENLDTLGIPVGAPIGTIFHNCGLAAILFLSVIASRRVLVPMNPLSTKQELEYMLRQAHCDLVIFDPDHVRVPQFECKRSIVVSDHAAYFHGVTSCGHPFSYSRSSSDIQPQSAGEVVYTSGSTGRPKGILLSQGSLLSDAAALARVYELKSSDRFLTVCPLFHNSGQVLTTLACAMVGGSTIAIRSSAGMLNFWSYIDKYRANWTLGMVSFLALLLSKPEEPKHPEVVRGLLTGGSVIDPKLVEQFESRFKVPVRAVYGLTESASISTCEYLDPSPRSIGSSGRPLPICDVRIGADLDTLAQFPAHASRGPGEIWISGPNIFDGYIGDPEMTKQRKSRDWLRTGDIGYFDEHGNLFVVDRLTR